MKVYFIRPTGAWNDDGTFNDEVFAQTTPTIAKMVFDSLTPELDKSLYTVRRKGEVSEGPTRPADEIFGSHTLYNVRNTDELFNWICRSIAPDDSFWTPIKSRLNCRQALFGYDGQAILCLRLEDPPPVSPMPDVINVEVSGGGDLTVGDLFDGIGFDD